MAIGTFDRLKNTPALKTTIRGPFHREKGLDASIGPKASIREKKQADISHIYITHRKQIYSSVPSYGNDISATKEDKDYFSNGDVTRDDS